MEVFCNGFPKAGSHALQKAVELLGHPAAVNHLPASEPLPVTATHHILIVRDPRDIVVSWLRFHQRAVTPGTFLSAFRRFMDKSLVEDMGTFAPWLDKAGTHVVKYEDLIKDDVAMHAIAAYLRTPYIDDAWEELEGANKDKGLTRTWNKDKSDYRAVWTPFVQSVWAEKGGNELLTRWGY